MRFWFVILALLMAPKVFADITDSVVDPSEPGLSEMADEDAKVLGADESSKIERLSELEVVRTQLDDLINHHKMLLNALDRALAKGGNTQDLDQRRSQAKSDLEGLRGAARAVSTEADELETRFELGANQSWGLVFKEGHENSRFGEQVEDYADLYTSRVSNLLYYSPSQYFRSPRQTMPHERRSARRGSG